MRRCSKCRVEKLEDGFYRHPRTRKWHPWCKRCQADYVVNRNASRRPERSCEWCAVTIPQTKKMGTRFCTVKCKRDSLNRRNQDRKDAAKPPRSCFYCDTPLPAKKKANARFCTLACAKSAHHMSTNLALRGGHKMKMRHLRQVLRERDGRLCQLCGLPLDFTKKWPDPDFVSVDHIVPLAVSWDEPNRLSNLQLAHLTCNARKSANAAADFHVERAV